MIRAVPKEYVQDWWRWCIYPPLWSNLLCIAVWGVVLTPWVTVTLFFLGDHIWWRLYYWVHGNEDSD